MLLQSNNGIPHTIAATSVTIENIKFEAVPYPPSAVLIPSGFWLFGVVKKHPKGIQFTCDEVAEGAIGKWFREQSEEIHSDKFEKK